MWDLTVQDTHTFYILTAKTSILRSESPSRGGARTAGDTSSVGILVHNATLGCGEQYVYRAVKDDELNQLLDTRRYTNVTGIESKYFSATPEGAAQYARAAYSLRPGEGVYTLTRGVIRSDLISADSRIANLADGGGGIDAFALQEEAMSAIGRVRVLPYMPVP
jgi:DNA-binding PadR family transcriptional regulator